MDVCHVALKVETSYIRALLVDLMLLQTVLSYRYHSNTLPMHPDL